MNSKIPLIALCATMAIVAACKPKDAAPPASPPDVPASPSDSSAPPAATSAAPVSYRCDGLDFTAQFDNDHVTLSAPGKEYVLPQVAAASGAKFESDKAMFWNKGSEALVQIDGKSYDNCREVSAAEAPPAP